MAIDGLEDWSLYLANLWWNTIGHCRFVYHAGTIAYLVGKSIAMAYFGSDVVIDEYRIHCVLCHTTDSP